MSDQVIFGADATEYFNVVARMEQRLGQLETRTGRTGSSADRIGEGYLRSERIVSRSTGNMVQNLIYANNAADALAASLLTVERSGKLGFGLAIGVAVGIAAYEAVSKKLEEIKKIDDDLAKAMGRPIVQQIRLDAAGLDKEISGLGTALDAKLKESTSYAAAFVNTYKGIFENLNNFGAGHPGGAFGSKGQDEDFAAIEAAQRRLETLGKLRGKAELDIAAAKAVSLHVSEREGEILRINAEFEAKRAAAILAAQASGAITGIPDTINGLRKEQALAIETANKKADLEDRALQHASDLFEIEKRGLSTQDEAVAKLKSEVSYRESLVGFAKTFEDKAKATLEVEEARLEVTKKQKDVAAEATKEAEKYAKAAKEAQSTTTPGSRASERRTERSENRREKELKNELSREGDPEKREDIKDQLTEIQQQRADRAQKKQDQEAARQAAEQQAAEAQAKAQAEAQKVAQQKAAEEGRASDEKELNKYGRILRPEERLSENIKDKEAAKQQAFQDQEAKRQKGFSDQSEADARGISVEQLQRERDFKKGKGVKSDPTADADSLAGKDSSSLASLASADFSGLQALADMDFSGLAPLNGLTIQIA